MYLLDTCTLSEFVSAKPNARVIAWLDQQEESSLYAAAVSIGELKRGAARLAEGKRKTFLQKWLVDSVINRFGERVLPTSMEVWLRWGEMFARLDKLGKPMPAIDALIAATALQHQLTVVTRNTRDMEASGVPLLNPWEAQP